MSFTIFDIVILTIFSLSSIFGLYRGMVYIIITLLGFVASIAAAIFFYSYVYNFFSGYIENEFIASITSGISSYIVSLIFFTFLTSKIVLLFSDSSKGIFDRLLGLSLGALRGFLLVLTLFAIVAIFTAGTYSEARSSKDLIYNLSIENYPDWLASSSSVPYLEKTLKKIASIVPEELWESVQPPQYPESNTDQDTIDNIKKRKNKHKKTPVELPTKEDSDR